MGVSALTRKGWEENPKKQGKENFFTSLIAIVVGTIVNLLLGVDSINSSTLVFMGIILLWGVVSLLMGILIDKLQ